MCNNSPTELSNFKHNGVTLNLDEKMQLEMALNLLRCEVKADEVLFWGKVMGSVNDYYLAVTVTYQGQYEFPNKRFYYTLSNTPAFAFKELPELGLPEPEQDMLIDNAASLFEGNPEKVLSNKPEGEEGEEEPVPEEPADEDEEEGEKKAKDSDESEEEEIKVPKRVLTELDRLATVVLAIENDCQICPVGAYKMTAQHELKRAAAFAGLRGEDACRMENYQHFRNVQSEQKKAALDQPEAPFTRDFLEPISADLPKGCWNLQANERCDNVLIRSLNWPGYQFFHRMSSSKFGGLYIGDGLKNQEVHFIVQ